jgi:hypothetical protein
VLQLGVGWIRRVAARAQDEVARIRFGYDPFDPDDIRRSSGTRTNPARIAAK